MELSVNQFISTVGTKVVGTPHPVNPTTCHAVGGSNTSFPLAFVVSIELLASQVLTHPAVASFVITSSCISFIVSAVTVRVI
jgi:hypothetical protein